MTFKEFATLADAIKTYFPRDNMLPTEKSMELWFDMLKDLDYKSAVYGLKKYVSCNKFPPAIADIRESAASIIEPEELNEMEAWALVGKAIRNSGYNSVSEFAKLPPLVQKAVGLPDQLRIWALDENYSEGVVSSNFIKCYRAAAQKERGIQKLPREVSMAIENTNKGSHVAHIDSLRTKLIENVELREKRGNAAIEEHTNVCGMPNKCKERLNVLFEE